MRLLPNDQDLGWTPYAWLVYVVPFAATPFLRDRLSTFEVVATLVTLAIFLVLYFRGYWAGRRESLLIIAALVAIGVAFWTRNFGAGAFFIYAAAFAGYLDPPRVAVRLIVAIAAIVLVQAWVVRHAWPHALWPLLFTVLIGGINVHFSQVNRSNARLRRAHDEIEHLAKVAERERIARDLHDLLGHTLSLVILKSELASKLAERDPERARVEIADVERIAREALAQVRSAVRGYRSGGLQAEVDSARSALAAAGVTLRAELDAIVLTPVQEAVLALTIREAVTNVIRHAGARNCEVTLRATKSICTLTIHDDGRGGSAPAGTGLTGMRERIEALAGTFARDGSRGTTLTISVPLDVASALRVTA